MHDWLKFVANFHILSFLLPQHLLVCLQLLSLLPFLFCHHLSSVAMDLKSLLLKLLLLFTLLLLVMGTCIVVGKEERERECCQNGWCLSGCACLSFGILVSHSPGNALVLTAQFLFPLAH